MSNTNATALQNTPQHFEPVFKKDGIKVNGIQYKKGDVFPITGSRHDASIIKHYCYMRPIQKEVKDA